MLNRLVFFFFSSEWRLANPNLSNSQKNQRDYASTEQLIILANLESLNSYLIAEKQPVSERIEKLAKESRRQYNSLINSEEVHKKYLDIHRKDEA